jgi:transposase InsO family protein
LRRYRGILEDLDIVISRSKKGCPWENGYQEPFYSQFKVDLGDPNRFGSLGEIVYEIYRTIHRYENAADGICEEIRNHYNGK